MADKIELSEDGVAERVTARDAAGDEAPVQASDPRSVAIDRGSVSPARPGASEDEAAAAQPSAAQKP